MASAADSHRIVRDDCGAPDADAALLVASLSTNDAAHGKVVRVPTRRRDLCRLAHVAPRGRMRGTIDTASEGEGTPLEEDFFTPEDLGLDLDDDGVPEIFVFAGAQRTTIEHEVYLRRGPCGYPLGHIESAGVLALVATKSRGLHDLRVMQEFCPGIGTRFCEVIHRFDGVRYRVLRRTALPNARPMSVP